MKDDYLWDKAGKDAEIEKLEASLAPFQYEPTQPPMVSDVERVSSRRRVWELWFVVVPSFAGIIVILVVVGLLFRTPASEVVSQPDQVSERPEQVIATTESDPVAPEIVPVAISQPSRSGTPIKKKVLTARAERRQTTPTLTAEEKYAYDRLMLALAITGSKLRIVQDKVNGLEVEKPTPDNKR